jgi:predicted transcriptional regulator
MVEKRKLIEIDESSVQSRTETLKETIQARVGKMVSATIPSTSQLLAPPEHAQVNPQNLKVQSKKIAKVRSEFEIIAAILKAASNCGGEPLTTLRQKANVSSTSIARYVDYMLDRNLLVVEPSLERNLPKIYRPTEYGYEFLLRQRELIALIDEEDSQLMNFWD